MLNRLRSARPFIIRAVDSIVHPPAAVGRGSQTLRLFSVLSKKEKEEQQQIIIDNTTNKNTQTETPAYKKKPNSSDDGNDYDDKTNTFLNKKSKKQFEEDLPVDFSDISRANVAIRGGVKRTSSVKSVFLSEIIGANVYLKPEFQQFTGSFKERGARNAILALMEKKGSDLKGVIAASAGNHALALAYHGANLGVKVTVIMPVVAPLAKVDKCRVSWSYFCVVMIPLISVLLLNNSC